MPQYDRVPETCCDWQDAQQPIDGKPKRNINHAGRGERVAIFLAFAVLVVLVGYAVGGQYGYWGYPLAWIVGQNAWVSYQRIIERF